MQHKHQRFRPSTLLLNAIGTIISVVILTAFLVASVQAQAPARDTRSWTDPGGSGVTITFSTPKTYESCTSISDRIYTQGIPANWFLNGSVEFYWATTSGQELIRSYPIRQNGNLDLTIDYPPASTWPDLNPIGNPLRELHIAVGILVEDGQRNVVPWVGGDLQFAPGILGAGGQVWDVICLPTGNPPTPTNTPVGPTPTNTPAGPTPTNTPSSGTAALGDRVWSDTNGNGIQDTGEPGVPGVKVELLANCTGNTVLATNSTNVNGDYIFDKLAAGQYRVRFTLPSGFSSFSPKKAILDDDYDSDANPDGATDCITLNSGEQNYRVDAGLLKGGPTPTPTNTLVPNLGSLGDRVWLDNNSNGIQDAGEPGVPGVTVQLKDCNNNVLRTTTTDANGIYTFPNLNTGCYVVRFININSTNFAFTQANQGGDDTRDSDVTQLDSVTPGIVNGQTDPINLAQGENNPTIDAGLVPQQPQLGSLGDRVWRDDNSNGIQDAGEPGVPGVTVQLKDCNNNVLRTTTTDANGIYTFGGLAAGCYRVGIVPNGFTISPVNQGNDDTRDSDVNPNTAMTDNINLAPGENNPTVDVGLISPPQLTCGLTIEQKCIVPVQPPAGNFNCSDAKPLNEVSMRWNGTQSVDVKAWKGSVGSTLLATVTNVTPNQIVTVTGYAGSPNDVIWEVFAAGTNSKLGESTFHLSCSDSDMNGPEDCGSAQGNGKKNESGLLNLWQLEGLGGNGQRFTCSSSTPQQGADSCTLVAGGGSVCNGQKPKSLTFRYTGSACSASTNPQGGKFQCSGSSGSGAVSVAVTGKDASKFSVTPSTVNIGQEVTIARTDGKEFSAETQLQVGGQTLAIHTSCSQALNLGDIFGSLVLVGADGQRLDTTVTFNFFVANSGDPLSNVSVEDSFGTVAGPFSLATGASRTFERQTTIADTVTNLGFVRGFLADGQLCSDEDRTTVTVEPPALSCDDGKPIALVFEYGGGSCSDTTNPQGGKFQCSGNPGSGSVAVSMQKDADKISVNPRSVSPGQRFTIARTDGKELASETSMQVGGQSLNIHTSCSQALNVGDLFGSLRLVQFVPKGFPVPSAASDGDAANSIFLPMITR